MKKSRFVLIILAVVIMIVACFRVYNTNFKQQTDVVTSSPAITNEKVSYEPVTVRYVVDGDTLTVADEDSDEFKVRLIGCNTPESVSSDENKNSATKKSPSTIRRKISILFGCFSKFFTPCLHLISPQQKIPLYNTEKNSSFVDVFCKKIYNLFYKNKNPHRFYR